MTDVCSVRACAPDLEPVDPSDLPGLSVAAARCTYHGVVFLDVSVGP